MGLKWDAASMFSFDFVADLLKAVEGRLAEVRVEKVTEEQLCGVVVLQKGGKIQQMRADVHDALLLAMYTHCPIVVEKDVIQMLERELPVAHESVEVVGQDVALTEKRKPQLEPEKHLSNLDEAVD